MSTIKTSQFVTFKSLKRSVPFVYKTILYTIKGDEEKEYVFIKVKHKKGEWAVTPDGRRRIYIAPDTIVRRCKVIY